MFWDQQAWFRAGVFGDYKGGNYSIFNTDGSLQFFGSAGIKSSKYKEYFLDPTDGKDTNKGKTPTSAFKTLTAAKAVMVDGDHLTLIGLADAINLSANMDWNLNGCVFDGYCAPLFTGKRARIQQLSSATTMNLFTVSGYGNIFRNLRFFHGVADATSLVCMTVTGQRNLFVNCEISGIGDAAMNVANAASLVIDGGSENAFIYCYIGLDTIGRGANPNEIVFKNAATRNLFDCCHIVAYLNSGATAYSLVKILTGTGIDRWQKFRNCLFQTDSENQTVTMASAFSIPSGIVQGKIILEGADTMLLTDGSTGSGAWDSNSRGIIWNNTPAPAATALGGISTKK